MKIILMVVCWLPHTGRAGRLGLSHCKFAGCCSPSPSSPPPSTGSWRTCGSSWWSCGWVGDPGEKEEEVLGPTILQAGGLPAAAALSGSSFPSPGRAGQLRRRGRIQNHRSESNIRVRNVVRDFDDFRDSNDHRARVKEQEDRILGGTRSVSRA